VQLELRQVKLEEKEILFNLIEKYEYEFSQYNGCDVNSRGLYNDLDEYNHYWQPNRKCFAYFIEVDTNLAGFVMVADFPEVKDTEVDFIIDEFFVMYKYRRLGVGKQAFFETLDRHKGKWQLCQHPKNIVSICFWEGVINEYMLGEYELIKSHPLLEYDDGILGDAFFFDNSHSESKYTM